MDVRNENRLLQAARHGRCDLVNRYLSMGEDARETSNKGIALLHVLAASNKNFDYDLMSRVMSLSSVDAPDGESLTALSHAAKSGNERMARFLIANGANVNHRSASGCTPLMSAARHSRTRIVKLLLNSGADPDEATCRGVFPLHAAAESGCLSAVIALIEHGADVNVADKRGATPLGVASNKGYKAIVHRLLLAGAEVDGSGAGDFAHASPLASAVHSGHADVVSMLLMSGASLCSPSVSSSLICAVSAGRYDIVRSLVLRGANTEFVDDFGFTPLINATAFGHRRLAVFLLEFTTDVDSGDYYHMMSPLHYAAENGMTDVVRLLVKKRADIGIKDKSGMSPLHYASKRGKVSVAKVLLDAGADINEQDYMGMTPLAVACGEHQVRAVGFLCSNGALVNAQDGMGMTALHQAVKNTCDYERCADTVRLLVRAGASLETKDTNDMTVFDTAMQVGNGVMNALIDIGADVNRTYSCGSTTLMLAASNHHIDKKILEKIITKSDVNARNKDGETALGLAAYYNEKAVDLLIRHGAHIDCTDKNGDTPLTNAIVARNHFAVRLLLERGAGDPRSLIAAACNLAEYGSDSEMCSSCDAWVIYSLVEVVRFRREEIYLYNLVLLARLMAMMYAKKKNDHRMMRIWCEAAATRSEAAAETGYPSVIDDKGGEWDVVDLERNEDALWAYITGVQELIIDVAGEASRLPDYCASLRV